MRKTLTLLAFAGIVSLGTVGQNPPGAPPRQETSVTTSSPGQPAPKGTRDPLLDLPELPPGKVTLIGGTVTSLDEIMNRMLVQPFGSKQKVRVAFDTRTGFFQDGKTISYKDIREGQRIYLDTMLNGTTVFAKKIWIQTSADSGIGRGQVVNYDPGDHTLTVRDELSNQPVKMNFTSTTVMKNGQEHASPADLVPGALVSLSFGPKRELREVTLLAKPGSTFAFAGRITYLDVSRKVIAIDNQTDRTKYDVSIEAIAPSIVRQLHEGDVVRVSAVFDGSRYSARNVERPSTTAPQDQ
jgi:cold shock CspA family protein